MKKRMVAEWEPAVGVLVAWPASLPQALLCKLAADTTVYLTCADEAAIEDARATFAQMGIDADAVRYLVVPQGDDSTWPRDWGPHALFDEHGNYRLFGPRYTLSGPYCDAVDDPVLYCPPWGKEKMPITEFEGDTSDDLAAKAIAQQLGLSFQKAPFAFTGGNVLNDGVNTILSTKVLLAENKYEGLMREDFFNYVAQTTGMTNYTVLSNYEDYALNHVDCFLKILDERRLLVVRPPRDHELYPVYESIVENEIARSLNSYGEPWEIIPVDSGVVRSGDGGEGIAAYVNSLILNTCVYVPMYGIPEDEKALQQWRDAMPGYDVQGFTFEFADEKFAYNPDGIYGACGWDPGDVLHCRTRAVWDPQMLHIDVPGPVGQPQAGKPVAVAAHVAAYSGRALVAGACKVCYRAQGAEAFEAAPLAPGPTNEVLVAELPAQPAGTVVEYYVAAADESGHAETAPRVAPAAFYTYTVA